MQRDQESVKWLRSRRRMIRREEMLGKMANRSPPPHLPPPAVSPMERQILTKRSNSVFDLRNRNSPQRRSPRPGPSSQPCMHRCNTNCNKELSNIQVSDQFALVFEEKRSIEFERYLRIK